MVLDDTVRVREQMIESCDTIIQGIRLENRLIPKELSSLHLSYASLESDRSDAEMKAKRIAFKSRKTPNRASSLEILIPGPEQSAQERFLGFARRF